MDYKHVRYAITVTLSEPRLADEAERHGMSSEAYLQAVASSAFGPFWPMEPKEREQTGLKKASA